MGFTWIRIRLTRKNWIRILPNFIDILLSSFDLKVNIIDILILFYYFGQKILQEKLNFRWILNLDDHILNTGSDLISKTGFEENTRIRSPENNTQIYLYMLYYVWRFPDSGYFRNWDVPLFIHLNNLT